MKAAVVDQVGAREASRFQPVFQRPNCVGGVQRKGDMIKGDWPGDRAAMQLPLHGLRTVPFKEAQAGFFPSISKK